MGPTSGPAGLREHVGVDVRAAGHGVEPEGPVDAGHDGLAVEEAAVGAVEGVEEAVLVVVEERLDRPVAAQGHVGEHRGAHRVVVPAVPGGVLVAPADGPVVGVEGDGRGRPLVVAPPHVAVPGGGVPGVPVDEVQLGVVGARRPRRGAAVPPGVAGPRLVAGLAGAGNGVGGPARLAGHRVVGLDEAPDAVLAARHPGEDEAVDDERRAGDAVALPPVDDLGLPRDGAGVAVEGEQARVHGADVDEPAVQRDAAVVRPTAVDALGLVGHLRLEAPPLRPGAGVDGEDARLVGRQVDDAVVHQRRRLQAPVLAPGREHPGRVEPVDVVRGDLVELDESVTVVVAAVHQPRRGVAGRLLEIERGDRLPVRRHGRPRRENDRRDRRKSVWRPHLFTFLPPVAIAEAVDLGAFARRDARSVTVLRRPLTSGRSRGGTHAV